ncbi:MAG: AmmeMemoRadiSam system radical SAM enzyme [Armatimonadota bacterium]|nr:AmmeMemoRadiSam system radical SAM enzyme [Armatimonadota bacterium]MCX7778512.1 AmmeMemoRadiSam system radical SAM enzyme [Armatimonadota bacterium]MDW8024942.1 AmmeMemoRadiSam system radical SAM enzyme [Armatimonadota bacterium]
MRMAMLYEELDGARVRCKLCNRQCIVGTGKSGFCRARVNFGGKLFTLTYGNLSAVESRPIEIKPFFHYHPGSTSLTFSTWSCNLNCAWCQNYHLSSIAPSVTSRTLSPEQVLEMALRRGDDGICVSFNEPTLLFEFCVELFPLARRFGLYCCFVSNGYMSIEALDALIDAGMDGMNVDVKGQQWSYDSYCGGADVEHIWHVAAHAKGRGVHVEIVCLLVTGVSDDNATIEWLIKRHIEMLGESVPIHFNRYFPAKHFRAPPTAIERLEHAYRVAKAMGVRFPYIGNVHGHAGENTYCPRCGEELIRRRSFMTVKINLADDSKCPNCGESIPIVGRARVSFSRG